MTLSIIKFNFYDIHQLLILSVAIEPKDTVGLSDAIIKGLLSELTHDKHTK